MENGRVTFERQLVSVQATTAAAMFAPPKTASSVRTVEVGAETVAALRAHRVAQRELKLRNGRHYVDYGLVFAKEDIDVQRPAAALGQSIGTLGGGKFHKVVQAAGVRRIKFHGLRHTCASLLLADGEPVNVVSDRLGHATVTMTLNMYAHSKPSHQRAAATRLSAILYGAARDRA